MDKHLTLLLLLSWVFGTVNFRILDIVHYSKFHHINLRCLIFMMRLYQYFNNFKYESD